MFSVEADALKVLRGPRPKVTGRSACVTVRVASVVDVTVARHVHTVKVT
ncbi:hypothetical protein [Streptomyces yanii]